jgi:hypothetical protein
MQNWIGSLPILERTRSQKQNYDRLGKVFMRLWYTRTGDVPVDLGGCYRDGFRLVRLSGLIPAVQY